MMARRICHSCILALAVAILPRSTSAQQCLVVEDDSDAPAVVNPEVDVKQVIRLTQAGASALEMLRYAHAYVEVTREERRETIEGKEVVTSTKETFVRLLARPRGKNDHPREAHFTFSRDGAHTLRLFGAETFTWPIPPKFETPVPGCSPLDVSVAKAVRRPDFAGVRAQWWGAYRAPAGLEAGGSIFAGRIGAAVLAELSLPRSIGPRDSPDNINPVTGAVALRWRHSRGHFGGGVRYYPDEELERDHWRIEFGIAEELPSWRGRPIWLIVDIRLQERRENFFKGLRPAVGVRFDLWGSRP
jgi:hypothetical protein